MSVITPKDLAGKSFSTAFTGYNKTEVDEYVAKVTKNYAALYRRFAELEESLAVANVRLENIAGDERRAKKTLENAKEKSDLIIAEAYERADDILVAVKKNCDAILRDFSRKVEIQKDAIAEMNARVEFFKKDIFEKYREHIEILEALSPPIAFDEEFTANEYVARIINELQYEITAEYDISVGEDAAESASLFGSLLDDPDLEEMPTEEEISAFINDLTRAPAAGASATASLSLTLSPPEREILPPEEIFPVPVEEEEEKPAFTPEIAEIRPENREKTAPAPIQNRKAKQRSTKEEEEAMLGAEEQEGFIPKGGDEANATPANVRSTRKKKKQLKSVLDMLREYEEDDARRLPQIEAQLMLNLDEITDALVSSPQK